ncbi:crossover junction endodeoxyribonuclease RuvC [Spirochaetia bacterium]|nr:crossover junction endodeoxyribonuclease RuvC [Spirochaetia bacterium]
MKKNNRDGEPVESGLLSRAAKTETAKPDPAISRLTGRGVRRIIGVDPGLASTGWGVVDYADNRVRYIAHGCIETKADRPRAERLFFIYQAIREALETYKPAESAIETLYFARNISSAMAVAEARGVLCMALFQQGLPVYEFTPNAIKQAVVGQSQADKRQVQEMIRIILGLPEIPKPDHAADALGAAVCCAHTAMIG